MKLRRVIYPTLLILSICLLCVSNHTEQPKPKQISLIECIPVNTGMVSGKVICSNT